MIEVRNSRVSGNQYIIHTGGWAAVFLRKGISPKDLTPVRNVRFWDDAEHAAYCHKCGALSVLWAYCAFCRNIRHRRVSSEIESFVVFLYATENDNDQEKGETTCIPQKRKYV